MAGRRKFYCCWPRAGTSLRPLAVVTQTWNGPPSSNRQDEVSDFIAIVKGSGSFLGLAKTTILTYIGRNALSNAAPDLFNLTGMAGIAPRELAPFPDDSQAPVSESSSRKKVSLACIACRRRRTKCDGGIPCASCLSRNTSCVKDENDDGRRKLAVKRRLEVLEKDRHLLDDLLKAVRDAGPNQLDALLNIIRADPSRPEITSFLQDQFSSIGDMDAQLQRQNQQKRHRQMMGRIQDVVNPPLQIPAKPWTMVTDDDDLVSHLMSLWFTWAHPWWHWVDEKEFIKAMQAGDRSSLICTPYLVNMILADACLLDTLAGNGTNTQEELREQFYKEAKKGLDAEEGHVSFAYLATLGVQWTYLDTNGQDNLGNAILYQQIFMIRQLGKWRAKVELDPRITPEQLHAVDTSLSRLEWTLYNLNLFIGLALEQVRLMKRPTRPKPVAFPGSHDSCDEQVDWQPYPLAHGHVNWHPHCQYLAYISLAEEITADEALYEEKKRSDRSEMADKYEDLFLRLEKWPETLKPCARMHDQAMPHTIALHALHSWVIITMAKQTAALEGETVQATLVSTRPSSEKDRWKAVCITEAIRIGDLLETMRQNWGADRFPVIIIQPATIAAFALMEDLESRPDSQAAFYKICIVLRAASRRFRVVKGVLHLLDTTSKENGIPLPEGCAELLSESSTAMEVDDRSVSTNMVEELGLDYLLEKWHDLDLD